MYFFFFFQAEDGIRDHCVTGVQTCALPILPLAWLEREAFPVAIGALYGIVLLVLMPGELVQDSWSTLVSGREIANHGLPHRETLTVMAQGVSWIDQQWLSQIVFYELFQAGGYRLILLV